MLPMGRMISVFTGLLFVASSTMAADLVVVKAEGIDLKAGTVIPGNQPLKLEEGQRLALIAPTGKTIRIAGPFEQPPFPDATTNDTSVVGSLKSMVKERNANTASLGITRDSATELPEPWLVDVGGSGERCVREGMPLVLWRTDGTANQPIVLVAQDGQWRAKATWPAGSQKLNAPPALKLGEGDKLTVEFEKGSATITARMVPASLATDAMRLAWLIEQGCHVQAAALARTVK